MAEQIKRGRGRSRKVHTESALERIKPAIPPELTHFDSLPGSAHVRLPVVRGLYGASASTIWRGVRLGTIPKPVKLSDNLTAWRVSDLRAALAVKGAA